MKMILALMAMKIEMKAYCQMKLRSFSEFRLYLREYIVVVVQNDKKRKKVPKWATTVELELLLN